MVSYIVGIFDQFRTATNAYARLRDGQQIKDISFMARDVANTDISGFLVDEEENIDDAGYYQIGSASSALISIQENFHTIPFTDIGNLVIAGPISDLLEIKYANGDEQKITFSEALDDVGLTNGLNQRYSDLVMEGRILLFVPQNHAKDTIINTLQDYGALLTEEIEIPDLVR